MITCNYDG